jgi:fructosamine-3-kinase
MIQSIPENVRQGVTSTLGLRDESALRDFSFSHGGCINEGGKLTTSSGTFFLKWNGARKFPLMFATEAKGLRLLRKVDAITIPDVIGVGEENEYQYILLEFIEQRPQTSLYWKLLGSRLATLHQATNDKFGLDHENYIGSLRQLNTPRSSWPEFFIHERLSAQLKLAVESGLAGNQMARSFELLFVKLESIIPKEKPSLLHGDLWSGNIITTPNGEPCLIDPAVYYGCREVDLAMTKLFGSFPGEFYDAYNSTYPLLPGYEDRFEVYNLYPLLVHLNLFGSQYRSPITSILGRFI